MVGTNCVKRPLLSGVLPRILIMDEVQGGPGNGLAWKVIASFNNSPEKRQAVAKGLGCWMQHEGICSTAKPWKAHSWQINMMDIKWLHYSEQKISWKEGWKYRSEVSVGEKAKDR